MARSQAAGRPRATEEPDQALLGRLYPVLRRFAAVVAPIELSPDDLLQQALLLALRRQALAGYSDPEAYLKKTMLNLASNERRRLGRQRKALSRIPLVNQAQATSYPSDLSDLLRLPPVSRAVLYLAEVEDHSYSEIARLLGVSEVRARATASRARRKLRLEVGEEVHNG